MCITVLLVDDQPLFRAALSAALHTIREDIAILPAGSLEDASRQIKVSTPPDLTVLDLHLPDACGSAALDAFRRRHPGLCIVAMTERPDPAIAQLCHNSGNVALVSKTAPTDFVTECLKAAIGGVFHVEGITITPGSHNAASAQADTQRWQPVPARESNPKVLQVNEPAPAGSARHAGVHREHHDGRHLGLTERQRSVLKLMMMGLPNKAICRELHLAEGTVKVHVSAVLRALGVSSRAQVAMAALRSGIDINEIVIA